MEVAKWLFATFKVAICNFQSCNFCVFPLYLKGKLKVAKLQAAFFENPKEVFKTYFLETLKKHSTTPPRLRNTRFFSGLASKFSSVATFVRGLSRSLCRLVLRDPTSFSKLRQVAFAS